MASELASRLPKYGWLASINDPSGADLTYHQIVYGAADVHPCIGLFTHGQQRPAAFGTSYDGQISMNSAMHGYLLTAGCASPRLIRQPVADELIRRKKLTFGVAGRVYGDGRKGEHLVAKMVAEGFKVLAWGHGWPCPVFSSKVDDLPTFYQSIDYYVDTSSDEGGCTPALEAMAQGIPVISHSLGVDRPVLTYETHDWPSLSRVLRALSEPRTYDDWSREHAEYFNEVVRR